MTIIHDNRNSIPRTVTFSCDYCGEQFIRYSNMKPKLDYRLFNRAEHFCSHKCAYAGRKPRKAQLIECNYCQVKLSKPSCIVKETNFCSRKCYWEYRKIDPRVKAPRKPCSDGRKKKISEVNKGMQVRLGCKLSQESKNKIAKKAKERFQDPTKNPMYGRHHTLKAREAMSKAHTILIVNGKKTYKNNHNTGYYTSVKTEKIYFYRSGWEKCCMKWLDKNSNVSSYQYEPLRIPYWIEGNIGIKQKRYYVPDFLIIFTDGHKEMWEIKPKAFQNNKRTQLKTKAAENYCKKNNIQSFQLFGKDKLKDLSIL